MIIATHILGYYEQIFSSKIGNPLDSTSIELVVPSLVIGVDNGNLQCIPPLQDIRVMIFYMDPLNVWTSLVWM